VAGARYASARRRGFLSYFLTFPGGGARLELMAAPGVGARPAAADALGYAHLALALGSRRAVDAAAARLRAAGVPVESGPRETGDGYYEAVVRDPRRQRRRDHRLTAASPDAPGAPRRFDS
jgi:lactoylglutathione lyase